MPPNDTHVYDWIGEVGGADWLRCPTCGRELFMSWPPNYIKVVTVEGDNLATHAFGKGGLTMGEATVIKEAEDEN